MLRNCLKFNFAHAVFDWHSKTICDDNYLVTLCSFIGFISSHNDCGFGELCNIWVFTLHLHIVAVLIASKHVCGPTSSLAFRYCAYHCAENLCLFYSRCQLPDVLRHKSELQTQPYMIMIFQWSWFIYAKCKTRRTDVGKLLVGRGHNYVEQSGSLNIVSVI